MSLLARRVRGPLWAEAEDSQRWQRGDFPIEVLADLAPKGGGLSVWEIASRRDSALKRIAAALIFDSNQIDSMEFRLVPKA